METLAKLEALRSLMKRFRLDAYLVPSADPHQSEYVPECWKRREWLSGFTGSAGEMVVSRRKAALWVDSRYWLQAEAQVDRRAIDVIRAGSAGAPEIEEWVAREVGSGGVLGVDPAVISPGRARRLGEALSRAGVSLRFPKSNLVDQIWEERPALPASRIEVHPKRYAGESLRQRLSRIQGMLRREGYDAHVVVALDAVAWLFEIRGDDVLFNPVVVAYAMLGARSAEIFLDPGRLNARLRRHFKGLVKVRPYEAFGERLAELGRRKARVLVDPDASTQWVLEGLRGARVVFGRSPIATEKAVKNAAEIRGLTQAHLREAKALVRFSEWLDSSLSARVRLRESEIAARLEELRSEEPSYKGPSFPTIAASGANAAVIHYQPRRGSDSPVRRNSVLLVDTGSQYIDGTTDATRTIATGQPSKRMREIYTRVLKGHLALSMLRFPAGWTGARLEAVAKVPLWQGGLDYGHGTGHGVGYYLNVHEGPIGFTKRRPAAEVALRPGHVLTIEPGYYEEGRFGFRIENQVLVVGADAPDGQAGEWYRFEPLTLWPYDRRLIELGMLSADEIAWIDSYHRRIRRLLRGSLGRRTRRWLDRATMPLRALNRR